jgi:hypothetical protein
VKAATPEQQQAAAPKPQQQQSLLSSLASSARKLLQGTWVGTDVPSFNGASMGYYQGEWPTCNKQLLAKHCSAAREAGTAQYCRPVTDASCQTQEQSGIRYAQHAA